MLPLGHLAVAYLAYVTATLVRRQPLPARWALLPLALGSQFPDLIDKPLAYYNIVTYGRSVAHSIFTTFLICTLLWILIHSHESHWGRDSWQGTLGRVTPFAFSVGYVSHLVGDAWRPLLAGQYWSARWLLWPIYSLPESRADEIAPWTRLLNIYQQMDTHPQFELLLAALIVFITLRIIARLHTRLHRTPTTASPPEH